MTSHKATISAVYRYPVKGLSPERLEGVNVAAGGHLPWDRAFAIENGGREFDPLNPMFMPKTKFLMLQRDQRLAALETAFDEETGTLTISRDGKQVARGQLTDPVGRQLIEQFMAAWMREELRGPPRIVHAPGHTISDCGASVLSLINLATVRDIGRVMGVSLDPLRFRGNLYVEGLDPWAEFDWVDRTVSTSANMALAGVRRIVRCAAVNVDPGTAARDLNILKALTGAFGHTHCGIYLKVETGGRLEPGQTLTG